MSTISKYIPFNPSNAVLAQLGEELAIPMVITSTRENLEFLGTNLPEIHKAAPIGYKNRVRRAGTLSDNVSIKADGEFIKNDSARSTSTANN